MKLLLDAQNVSLSYPRPAEGLKSLLQPQKEMKPALDNVSFTMREGERLALVGLNGSGKSTLLRTIAGIYEPDSGNITVNGQIVALFNLGIGMRMEMSGRANIILQGMVAGRSNKEMLEILPNIIEFSELGHVIDDPIHTYSQGMAMRLIFATATELKPEILLLDEWIGAGDRIFRKKAQDRLENMVANSSGFILASHNTMIVKRYCNVGLYLKDGAVAAYGEIESVLEQFNIDTIDQR